MTAEHDTDAADEVPAEPGGGDAVDEATGEPEGGDAVDEAVAEKPAGVARRALHWCREKWMPLAAAVLLIAASAVSATLYFQQYQPDQQTGPGARQGAIRAASDGTVALLSYSPDTLDRDFSAAKQHLTGDFLSYYNQFTQQIVAPAAKQKGVKTSAAVIQSAVSELHPDSAVVLLFVNQSTTSTDRPEPSLASSSVLVTLTKVNGAWLISKFDPV